MGMQVEFNAELALRNISEFNAGRRKIDECIPEKLEKGKTYDFLKEGQRNYWLLGEVPLIETKGNMQLSRPLASVKIIEAMHFLSEGKPFTKGKYLVMEAFDPKDARAHFDGFFRI